MNICYKYFQYLFELYSESISDSTHTACQHYEVLGLGDLWRDDLVVKKFNTGFYTWLNYFLI